MIKERLEMMLQFNETRQSAQAESPIHYDAVFLHGQGYKRDNNPHPRPSLRGRLEIAAAKYLPTHGIIVDHYVFSGYVFSGKSESMASVDAEELKRKISTESDQVIIDETARTTSMEIAAFRKIADENGWTTLLDITAKHHTKEVNKLVKRKFGVNSVRVISSESILENIPNSRNRNRYRKIIKKIQWSSSELRIRVYERLKYLILYFPYGDKLLENLSHNYRPDPS